MGQIYTVRTPPHPISCGFMSLYDLLQSSVTFSLLGPNIVLITLHQAPLAYDTITATVCSVTLAQYWGNRLKEQWVTGRNS